MKPYIGEDWLSVIVALILMLLALAGAVGPAWIKF
jgi:hypothetical protein